MDHWPDINATTIKFLAKNNLGSKNQDVLGRTQNMLTILKKGNRSIGLHPNWENQFWETSLREREGKPWAGRKYS